MLGWHDMEDYFDEDELDCLKDDYTLECLSLQQRNIIEYVGRNGLMDKRILPYQRRYQRRALFDDLGGMGRRVSVGIKETSCR